MNNVQTLKGFRDFLPKEARKRQFVIKTLRSVFELYGFEPLETPTLEYEEILLGKYGDEGDKLMYRFEDNGGRRVAMRYDQTVPLARVVNQYRNELPLPFKRYQIQNVWRAENTQKGRFREFLQCDIDTVGTESKTADAEIVALVNTAFEKLGFKEFTIQINDRSIFGNLPTKAIIIIDKLEKVGKEQVEKELKENNFDPNLVDELQKKEIPDSLQEVFVMAKSLGVSEERLSFNPTLARGLDYYTGMIIEVVIKDYTVGSVGGGGRYDNLLGLFGGETLPAVGFAFGFDRVMEAMNEQGLFDDTESSASSVMVSIFSEDLADASRDVAKLLREKNIDTELWLDPKSKMEKQLKYADAKDKKYVVIIGPNEAKENKATLKNLKTRDQKTVDVADLPNEII